MASPLLVAQNVRKVYGATPVLEDVSIELFGGEIHAIIGENGAGKSTLAKIIAGVVRPTAGEIFLEGRSVRFSNPREAMSQGIALIHQEPLTFPNLSIAENVFVGNQPGRGKVDWKQMEKRTAQLMATLGVVIEPRSVAGNLSIAGQQMVELASALSHEAKVIICDETTASLTPKEVNELFVVLRSLRDQGKAIVFVSHRLDEIIDISDKVTVLRDGEKVSESLTRETSADAIVRQMVGRAVETRFQRSDAITGGAHPLLRINNLASKGKFQNISFEVRKGEVVGLAGLVGAGRTEICESIFGVAPATAGNLEFEGSSVKIRCPQDAIRLGIGMVPEDRAHHGLHTTFNIRENAVMAVFDKVARIGWLNRKRETDIARDAISATQVACRGAEQTISELSGGNQQKVSLSKWLEIKPKLLILDEPTRGVDIGAKEGIHRIIRDLADKENLAVLMVSSDLNEILGLSDRIVVIREGSIAGEFLGKSATSDEIMLAATGQVNHAT